ncbi:MAG TPA: restriction endonuclease subunit S [Candidatus Acidoferrum sp.]|nr:restriction endonuclease subunit S [Candidatus Acidoferrum sp.]
MAHNWTDKPLGDVITLQRGFDLPIQDRKTGNVPIVSSSGVTGTHSQIGVRAPGVVTGRYGTIGQVFYIEKDFWPLNTTLYVKDFKGNDPRFISYLLQTIDYLSCSDKSSVPGVNRNDLHQIMVAVPEVSEQRMIAGVLKTLDAKIDLNRAMNETLEAMARAIFKSWFVDFDPIRAKAAGRQPFGMDSATAALFPQFLVGSEFGKIPAGWKVLKLSNLCSTQYGYTTSAVETSIGPKFLRVMDINKQNWIDWSLVPHCSIDDKSKDSYSLKVGDILVARMADPGKSAIIDEDVDAVFASYLVRLKTNSLPESYYIYGFLKSDQYAEYSEGVKSGSVQANMNARVIVGATVVVPTMPLMEAYFRVALPLRQRIVLNVNESNTLANIRDALLPKLVSGEIRVKDAEKIVGGKV